MEIAGLPLHPLIVHAAVVFTPLACVLAVVFAVVPRWRYLTRWPTVVTAVLALASVWVARFSGVDLAEARPELQPIIVTHRQRGELLSLLMIGFTVIVFAVAWTVTVRSGFASGAGERVAKVAVLDKVMPPLLVTGAVVVLVWTVLTADAGARTLWG